jgi:glutaredoxin 3
MGTGQPDIVMYTKKVCPYCVAAKNLLRTKGVTWREINVEESPGELEVMMRRTQRRTVPQIFIGETHVGGYDDLAALDRAGELNGLLGLPARTEQP